MTAISTLFMSASDSATVLKIHFTNSMCWNLGEKELYFDHARKARLKNSLGYVTTVWLKILSARYKYICLM